MEKWKRVEGFNDYEVSTQGRVRSYKYRNPKYLKGRPNADGYLRVCLCKDGVVSDFQIHRIMALAFIDNPENKSTVNHKNGIRDDNRIENLEWFTRKEQSRHMVDVNGYAHSYDSIDKMKQSATKRKRNGKGQFV